MGFGDITRITTTGASQVTANQDRLRKGVEASRTMAQTDLGRMAEYKSIIKSVGRKKGVDPAIIAGIISRESRAGSPNVIKPPEYLGYDGFGFGLMQVDKRYHTVIKPWNSKGHIEQGTQILVDKFKLMQNKFDDDDWTDEMYLQGALAAYNMGEDNVHSYEQVDAITTGQDYSSDVVARAQYYKGQGYYI